MFPACTLWNFGVLAHLDREGCIWFFFAFSPIHPPLHIILCLPPTRPVFSSTACLFVTILWPAWSGEGASLHPCLVTLTLRSLLPSCREDFEPRDLKEAPSRGSLLFDLLAALASLTQRRSPCVWAQLHLTEFSFCGFSVTSLCLVQRYCLSLPSHLNYSFVLQKKAWWDQTEARAMVVPSIQYMEWAWFPYS